MSDYKEQQKANKQRRVQQVVLTAHRDKKINMGGTLYLNFKEGLRKVGMVLGGQEHILPPEPKNKKERRKMRAGKPYIDKKGNLREVSHE